MTSLRRTFDSPDEVEELGGVRSAVLQIGEIAVARTVHPVGWRWSIHVRTHVGTDRCRTRHVGIVQSGRFGIELEDGSCHEFGPNDLYDVPPGHDGWVIGDEPAILLEWSGVREWLRSRDADRLLATLLFTDIVDSTPLAARLGDRAWRALLASHDDVLRNVLHDASGRLVKHTGDGVLALFHGPARALAAAVRIRHALEPLGLKVRQAVHVGEVEVRGEDFAGLAVHEAARILSAAGPSEVLVSEIAHALATSAPYEFDRREGVHLKGLAAPWTLFAVRR